MKKLLFYLLLKSFLYTHLMAQNASKLHIGLDVSPYQNISGQHEFFIEHYNDKKAWLNPYLRIGCANRNVQGGDCRIEDLVENQRAQGWFIRIGNDYKISKRLAFGVLMVYNNYKSSALRTESSPKKLIEFNNQKTTYLGINLRFNALNKTKWGLYFCCTNVTPLQKEQFLG
jgi:hypothetical protein